MTFPILGANSAVGGYAIDNSVRLDDASNAHLSKTFASSGNKKTFTFSCWSKGQADTGNYHSLFTAGSDNPDTVIWFTPDEKLRTNTYNSGSIYALDSQAIYRDPSAWYHIVVAYDTTQATSSNRIKMYVNGEEIAVSGSYPSLNYDTFINNSSYTHRVGSHTSSAYAGDGYLAEVHFIDGQQLDASSFGEFDEDSGIWKPIEYTGTYGTNGFYLDFENSGSLGADQSGNGNDFTPTNLASTDQTTDTPTNNFATLNPLSAGSDIRSNGSFSEGNCELLNGGTSGQINGQRCQGTMGFSNGKWYWEGKLISNTMAVGIIDSAISISANESPNSKNFVTYNSESGEVINASGVVYTGSTYDNGDIISVLVDADNGYVYFAKNGIYQNSGDPTSGASGTGGASFTTDNLMLPYIADNSSSSAGRHQYNFGNPPFSISSGNSDDNGYGNFEYAPPSGYLALCTQNLATELSPTIDDGSEYFHTQLYTGDGTSNNAITNDANAGDFQPDWIWIKNRTTAVNHVLHDSSRGASKRLYSNATDAETTTTNFSSFDTDGFTLGGGGQSYNDSAKNYVAWQWKANAGSTSSNTDGSITSTVQTGGGGFSIVTYTGNGGTNVSVGHGLNSAPEMLIVKSRDGARDWLVYTQDIDGSNDFLRLNTQGAKQDSTASVPTSSVFYVTGSDINTSGEDCIAYCFHSVEGFSKFGSYTGNGSSDGTFVYLGFRPAWTIIKRTDATSDGWYIHDSTRKPFNENDDALRANSSNAESGEKIDYVSNGFKHRIGGNNNFNGSGASYIYMAFAESPFVTSSGIPVVAR